jgi:hypothetical protein
MIPNLYFDYLRSGDARPLNGIFYHNAVDVLSMAALLSHMAELLAAPLNTGAGSLENVAHGVDLVAMGKLFEGLSRLETATQLYALGLTRDLPEETHWEALRRLSFVHKRRGDLVAALGLWRQAARGGHVYAHVELAKYYEHRARDYRQAADWTEEAIVLVQAPSFPRSARRGWLAELEHRLVRLRRRLDHP